MKWKTIAKKISLLYWINANIKCYELKRDRNRLERKYELKAAAKGYSYDSNEAVNEFKRRLYQYRPDYIPAFLGELKIFWVGVSKDQDETGLLQALHRIGQVHIFHNITGKYGLLQKYDFNHDMWSVKQVREANDKELLKQINRRLDIGEIDVLIGQMWAHLISKEALADVQKMGIPVINIAMDDRLPIHWSSKEGVKLGSIGLGNSLDMALTTAQETCQWYGLEGCPSLFWPLASDPEIFSPDPSIKRDIAVLFIGNCYGIRGKIVAVLNQHDIKVECFGGGWSNGYVNAEQNATLSKRARIILGVGTVGHCKDVYTIKLRDFDAMMTGALYITHRNPDLCSIFKEGKEIECYSTPKEAAEKIKYYLNHPEKRKIIAKAGQKKAITLHTWDVRWKSTLLQLGLIRNSFMDS